MADKKAPTIKRVVDDMNADHPAPTFPKKYHETKLCVCDNKYNPTEALVGVRARLRLEEVPRRPLGDNLSFRKTQ